jgi:predicted GH43/DUF377 family glycosyl hydrolase
MFFLYFLHLSISQIAPAQVDCRPADFAALAKPVEDVPPNQPESRHANYPVVHYPAPELPGFVSSAFVRHGFLDGFGDEFYAVFNPTAWVAKGTDGKEKVFLVVRGEKELKDATWNRKSLPYLAVSEDGIHFKPVSKNPLFEATEWYEKAGGVEDPRYFDMRLQPYVDPKDGKSFDGAILYTAFDGDIARVAIAYFNHDAPTVYRKGGLLFSPEEVKLNPLVPQKPEWNKSPSAMQFRDAKSGKIRNIIYVGEGNAHHGGIMAIEGQGPMQWKWPVHKKPAIQGRMGHYDEGLVEPAFAPVIAPLPADLAKKTGEKNGIYMTLHGDSPPRGYQVGYRIFSLNDPAGKPIYESNGPFLWPELPEEKHGQVGNVVFASGSVEFQGRRFIYYGAADKRIGVASAPAVHTKP